MWKYMHTLGEWSKLNNHIYFWLRMKTTWCSWHLFSYPLKVENFEPRRWHYLIKISNINLDTQKASKPTCTLQNLPWFNYHNIPECYGNCNIIDLLCQKQLMFDNIKVYSHHLLWLLYRFIEHALRGKSFRNWIILFFQHCILLFRYSHLRYSLLFFPTFRNFNMQVSKFLFSYLWIVL